MKKKLLSLMLAASLVLGLCVPAMAEDASSQVSYTDVADDAWYATAVAYVTENGIMSGVGEASFGPDIAVTRGMVYQTLYNLAGHPDVSEPASFSDVSGKWYSDAVAWAEDEGLAAGTGDGVFGGDSDITRQELGKILSDYALSLGVYAANADLSVYSDASSVADWAKDGMEKAVALGIISGSQDLLSPLASASRSELAQMLMKFSSLSFEIPVEEYIEDHAGEFFLTGENDSNGSFACFVPFDIRLSGVTADGQTFQVNDPSSQHGYGDYIVCANVNGQPDFSSINVVCGSVFAETYDMTNAPVAGSVAAIEKYGNLDMDIKPAALYSAGFELGDILKVTVNGQTFEIPFCTAYSDVNTGENVIRDNKESDILVIAINMGNFAETYGVQTGDILTFSMAEKAGYLGQYQAHQLQRTNERSDKSSDEVFSNFSPIVMGDIAEGVLYRTSSPVNPEIGRAAYADDLIEKAGVRTIIDLADDSEAIQGYFAAEGFDSPYFQYLYDAKKVIALNMGVDYKSADFQSKLKSGLEFMINNEGPYAIHCNEGKDRAGFTAILLEALMGASLDEIVADYMVSYENYYHVEKDSEQYKLISEVAVGMVRDLAGLEKDADLSDVDLIKAAEGYLTNIGLTADQISELKTLLSTPVAG